MLERWRVRPLVPRLGGEVEGEVLGAGQLAPQGLDCPLNISASAGCKKLTRGCAKHLERTRGSHRAGPTLSDGHRRRGLGLAVGGRELCDGPTRSGRSSLAANARPNLELPWLTLTVNAPWCCTTTI